MEGQKARMEEQLEKMADEIRKDDLITFEELGIDSLLVDETHAFKNLAIFSKMNVAGITGSGNQRAMDMYLKCQYINEINGGRGIVFATGPPSATRWWRCMSCSSFYRKTRWSSLGFSILIHEPQTSGSRQQRWN